MTLGANAIVQAEFTIYPFVEGMAPPPHVQSAIDAIRALGIEVTVGPLSNTIVGQVGPVLAAITAAEGAALSAGASRFVLNLEPAERR